LLNANRSSIVQAFRQYNQFGGGTGSLTLVNSKAPAGEYFVPLHMYDLTSTMNISPGLSISQYSPFLRPVFSDHTDSATIRWMQDTNTAGLNWKMENSTTTENLVNTYPGGECTLDWIQAKMLFYCPALSVSRFQIDIVRIKDPKLVPNESLGNFQCAFWQAAVKRFAYSPLEPGDHKYSRNFKVLHSQSFIMEPKETTENESAHYREVNIFLRMNKGVRYDYEDADRMYMQQTDGQYNTGALTIRNTVQQKYRTFLMIRAQSKYTETGVGDPLYHPSYDIVLRKKSTQLTT